MKRAKSRNLSPSAVLGRDEANIFGCSFKERVGPMNERRHRNVQCCESICSRHHLRDMDLYLAVAGGTKKRIVPAVVIKEQPRFEHGCLSDVREGLVVVHGAKVEVGEHPEL